MTYAEKLKQEEAYKEYEMYLAKQFEESQDGEFEINDDESKKWDYLKKDHQSLEIIEEKNEPNSNL